MANTICLHSSKGRQSTRTNEMVLLYLRKRPLGMGQQGRLSHDQADKPIHLLRVYHLASKAKD